ncbi:MAG: methyltransferase [Bacilli bacterium]|nr:methyltransferase [Bacilli bacterium]
MTKMLNDLYDYVPLKIYQDDKYFKFSLDSVLLAEYVNLTNRTKNIIELCSGNCAVSMILSTKTNAKITAVEVQKEIYELGKESIEYNKLSDKINLVLSDVKDVKNYFPGNNIDVIVCNPPYFKKDSTSYINDDKVKAIARHELLISLDEIIQISSNILQKDGELYLVHRPERLDEIINCCFKYNINVKNIQLVSTKDGKEPTLVLVKCVKGSNPGIKIRPIISIQDRKTFKNIFRKE